LLERMIPKQFETATILLLLAPVSAGFGLWMVFESGMLRGVATSPVSLVETSVGLLFFAAAIPMYFSSLGAFASTSASGAEKWLRWLGKLRPKLENHELGLARSGSYRGYALAFLLLVFLQAILLIPGIGEDRQFPLNEFYGLFSSLWYFYVLATGVSGFILIYSRRTGGYVLAIIMSVLGVGTVIPDVLGFLPPSIPTLRTILLELSGIPLEVLLIYVSWKAFRFSVST
jgi:hypothetical protein